jgi:hypothetical protein
VCGCVVGVGVTCDVHSILTIFATYRYVLLLYRHSKVLSYCAVRSIDTKRLSKLDDDRTPWPLLADGGKCALVVE